jgi:queuine tRNA-ribosyltransferase
MEFKIIAKDKKSKARVGLLQTKSGSIETPFFMPVCTQTTVKYISSHDLQEMGAKAVISNALVLSLRPGQNLIKKFGGIGKFMRYQGVVFTDSGGFQMYNKSIYEKSDENGVLFKNPISGGKVYMTPEDDMKLQIDLNSDVAMCLDSMPLIEVSKEDVAEAVRKTGMWAIKCKIAHDELQKNIPKNKRQLLFGICQGGIHKDLRELSARHFAGIDFDGYAIGGLALGEEKEDEYAMIELAKNVLPEDKPIYLMGAGNPVELIEAISRGCDIFDSRFPTRNARNGSLFSSKGTVRLMNNSNRHSNEPIDSECKCFVCKTYTRAYLRHLLDIKDGNGLRLASYHNLYFLQDLMRKAREAIKKGKFTEFKKDFIKNYKE